MKPILFNTNMVCAIQDDRKTVTRRVVRGINDTARFLELTENPSIVAVDKRGHEYPKEVEGLYADFVQDGNPEFPLVKSPYRPGDILYVRETWAAWSRTTGTPPVLYYRADLDNPDGIKWKPSIHMPREAARIFLRVTDVWVERVQEIIEEQAQAEGVKGWMVATDRDWDKNPNYILAFRHVWNSTIKTADRAIYGWEANPWVWVIEFKRCEKPESD